MVKLEKTFQVHDLSNYMNACVSNSIFLFLSKIFCWVVAGIHDSPNLISAVVNRSKRVTKGFEGP